MLTLPITKMDHLPGTQGRLRCSKSVIDPLLLLDTERISGRKRRADEGLEEVSNLVDALTVTDAAENEVFVEGLRGFRGFQVEIACYSRECVGVFSIVAVGDFLRIRRRWLGFGHKKRHFQME